jgi:threonine dehydrogenase-like Zn-dependent dehydrogenase
MDFVDRSFPAALVEVDEPRLPGPDWARLEVITGGICGSDLHIFSHNTGPSPTIVGYTPFPFVLGHEIAGRVVEAGPGSGVTEGMRAAVEPTITCEARDIVPPCGPCARGDISSCQRLDSKVTTPGMALGFTTGLGGGWAEQVVAHRSMLFPIPDAVPDRAASLHEPLSIAIHGLLRRPPAAGVPVCVVGCGIIGLAVIAGLRALFPDSAVVAVARHPHQAAAARACGAGEVVMDTADGTHVDALAALCDGARVIGRKADRMLSTGFPYVVDAVGAPRSVTDALRIADNRGTVLLLGAANTGAYDLTALYWKELELVGAINHSFDPGPGGGPARHSVERAVEVLAGGGLPHEAVVTHEFGLEDFRTAVETAIDRRAGAIKIVFRPAGPGTGR